MTLENATVFKVVVDDPKLPLVFNGVELVKVLSHCIITSKDENNEKTVTSTLKLLTGFSGIVKRVVLLNVEG